MNHVQSIPINIDRTTGITLADDAQLIYMAINGSFMNLFYISPALKPSTQLRLFLCVEAYISIRMENHVYVMSHYDPFTKKCYHLFEEIKN